MNEYGELISWRQYWKRNRPSPGTSCPLPHRGSLGIQVASNEYSYESLYVYIIIMVCTYNC